MLENLKAGAARVGMFGSALGGALFLGLVLAGPSNAQGDPAADAISDLGTKVTTYGTAIVGLVVLSIGFFLGIKYLRKGVSKA